MFRDKLLAHEDLMKDYYKWVKAQPEYPHMYFDGAAIRYMKEVMGIDLEIGENVMSQ